MKCEDCRYVQKSTQQKVTDIITTYCCTLTHRVMHPGKETDCRYYNADLSSQDICYNCIYYRGGKDWGLFCSCKEKYFHIGSFDDEPCEDYQKRD